VGVGVNRIGTLATMANSTITPIQAQNGHLICSPTEFVFDDIALPDPNPDFDVEAA
jgi:hypothetical protein